MKLLHQTIRALDQILDRFNIISLEFLSLRQKRLLLKISLATGIPFHVRKAKLMQSSFV